MTNQIKICTLNCRGLRDKRKRTDVFNYIRDKGFSMYCLQDVHWDNKWEKFIRSEWGYDSYIAGYNTNSRGVAILFNNNFDFKVNRIKRDDNGNWIAMDIHIKQLEITMLCLYGPNKDTPDFYALLKDVVNDFNNPLCILCGDWNLVQDPIIDTYNYDNINNPKAREYVLQMMEELNMCDPWRVHFPGTTRYTWRRQNPLKQARLDFFLISSELLNIVEFVDIQPGYRTDHSCVVLHLRNEYIKHGKGTWKFNNSLLKEDEYVSTVRNSIDKVKSIYAATPYNPVMVANIPSESLNIMIDDQLFFEMLLLEIRGETIAYASKRRKNMENVENELNKAINDLELQLSNFTNDTTKYIEIASNLKTKQLELELMRSKKLNGSFVRSKAKWIEHGEKPTKYFLNLEKQRFVNKTIGVIETDNGRILRNQESIDAEITSFYKQLYSKVDNSDTETLNTLNGTQLTNEQAQSIEGILTLEELTASLNTMKNDKSPGPDGFTVEFYKAFWSLLSQFLLRAVNTAFTTGTFLKPRTEGSIILLPKGNKPRKFIRNWRPISLLNVSYKIGSASIANRIKNMLPFVIHEDQTGFVPGRYIGENIRLIYDLMHYAELRNIPGMLLLIDFEKAFDTISHDFILRTLKFFNFGPDIIQWFSSFYSNASSSVIINGHISKSFSINRGCRQGDSLSPYLFVLCVEVVAIMIRKNESIKGFQIDDSVYKLTQYADDTTVILDGSKQSLEHVISTLDTFRHMCGLKINKQKTSAVWIGSNRTNIEQICPNLNLDWKLNGVFEMLGVKFSTNLKDMVNMNYTQVLDSIKNVITMWSKRFLTVYGRVTVVKCFMLSKFNYIGQMLPNPSDEFLREVNEYIFKFIWNGKPDRIKRSQMIQEYHFGGVKVPHIICHLKALKISWLRRIELGDQKWIKLFHLLSNLNKNDIYEFGENRWKKIKNQIKNKFWYDVLYAWANIIHNQMCDPNLDYNSIARNYLWWNDKITVGNQSVRYKHWYVKGVVFINDLLKSNGKFLSFREFCNKYHIRSNIIEYSGIVNSIKSKWPCIGRGRAKVLEPFTPMAYDLLLGAKKGCKPFYKLLLKNVKTSCNSPLKWQHELGVSIDIKEWQRICYRPMQITKDAKLHWFQYRILNNILGTNRLLYKMKIKDNDHCSFCNSKTETIFHLLYQCDIVTSFWKQIQLYIRCILAPTLRNINITPLIVILGTQKDDALDLVLLLAKFHIYRARVQNTKPNVITFKHEILFHLKAEKSVAISNNRLNQYDKKWANWNRLFV